MGGKNPPTHRAPPPPPPPTTPPPSPRSREPRPARPLEKKPQAGRGGARESEMRLPALRGVRQIRIDVGAVENVAGAARVNDAVLRHRQRRRRAGSARLVVPQQAALAERYAADAAAAALEIVEHGGRRHVHLLAKAFGHDRDVDEGQQLVGVGAHGAAVERGEDPGIAALACVVQRRIRLVPVEVERAAARQIDDGKRMKIVIVAGTHDRALALVRPHEGQGRPRDLPDMELDLVLGRHVLEHAAEPVAGDGSDQVRLDAELRAAERGGHGVAAERDGVLRGDVLLVADRDVVGDEGHIDIGLADEEGLHGRRMSGALERLRVSCPRGRASSKRRR